MQRTSEGKEAEEVARQTTTAKEALLGFSGEFVLARPAGGVRRGTGRNFNVGVGLDGACAPTGRNETGQGNALRARRKKCQP